jgi:hypothetical protein
VRVDLAAIIPTFFTDPYTPVSDSGNFPSLQQKNYTFSLFLMENEEDEEQIFRAFHAVDSWMVSSFSLIKLAMPCLTNWSTRNSAGDPGSAFIKTGNNYVISIY